MDVGELVLASNKTLIGIGANTALRGGLTVAGSADNYLSNIIIRNLNIQGRGTSGSPADGLGIRFSHHVWVDHCNLWDAPDGILDVTRGADYVTISWSRFWYTDANHPHALACLVSGGGTHTDTDTGHMNTTWHHNWWVELVQERMPRYLFGKGHIYNNYYTSSGNNYCIRVGAGANVLIENNYFDSVNNPHEFGDVQVGTITARGNEYVNTTGDRASGDFPGGTGAGTPFVPSYSYTADPASAIPDLVRRCSGPQ
jgi:pectate lyase